MGYRSTIILGIPPKQKEEFDKIQEKHGEIFKLAKEDEDMLIYEAEYLKWYSGYDEVEENNTNIKTYVIKKDRREH